MINAKIIAASVVPNPKALSPLTPRILNAKLALLGADFFEQSRSNKPIAWEHFNLIKPKESPGRPIVDKPHLYAKLDPNSFQRSLGTQQYFDVMSTMYDGVFPTLFDPVIEEMADRAQEGESITLLFKSTLTGPEVKFILDRLEAKGVSIDRIILTDISTRNAAAGMGNAMEILEPYRERGVVKEIDYYLLKEQTKRKKDYANESAIGALAENPPNYVIFTSAIHLVPLSELGEVVQGIYDVVKPGGELIVGSANLENTKGNSTAEVFDERFRRMRALAKQFFLENESHPLSAIFREYQDHKTVKAIEKVALPVSPARDVVVDAFKTSPFNVANEWSGNIPMSEETAANFYLFPPYLLNIVFPEFQVYKAEQKAKAKAEAKMPKAKL